MTVRNSDFDIAGGPGQHIPVMLNEVLDCLQPANGKTIIDGTFGAGGYSTAILEAGSDVVAIDRDPNAIRDGQALVAKFEGRLSLAHAVFADIENVAEQLDLAEVEGAVFDIGVSSMQLDQAERGFSFRADGPLDMRMSRDGVSAADVVNQAEQKDLTRIIGLLGEERKASQISRGIVAARSEQPIETTAQLASIIEKIVHRRATDRIHPATRTFQALRIFVNQELQQLCAVLFAAERLLRAGGRLVLVTFHSLEDRIVKQFFQNRAQSKQASRHMPSIESEPLTFALKGNGLIKPTKSECDRNPRARSAKLRWGTRTDAEPRAEDYSIFGLPMLADVAGYSAGGAR